jgi:hypothetical protein
VGEAEGNLALSLAHPSSRGGSVDEPKGDLAQNDKDLNTPFDLHIRSYAERHVCPTRTPLGKLGQPRGVSAQVGDVAVLGDDAETVSYRLVGAAEFAQGQRQEDANRFRLGELETRPLQNGE